MGVPELVVVLRKLVVTTAREHALDRYFPVGVGRSSDLWKEPIAVVAHRVGKRAVALIAVENLDKDEARPVPREQARQAFPRAPLGALAVKLDDLAMPLCVRTSHHNHSQR